MCACKRSIISSTIKMYCHFMYFTKLTDKYQNMIILHIRKPALAFALTIISCSIAFAQSSVKGKVTDQGTGQPIPNVNITVKGTTRGVASNGEGVYSIMLAAGDSVLVFSSSGYTSQEVGINGRSVIDLSLATN